jgi:glutamate 5-kinase
MSRYADLFKEHGLHSAQVLVTKSDFRDRNHYQNMKNCFENLLTEHIVPIVNENDTVATSHLVFTDNDELAGLIASQLSADAVIFLTSIGGVMASEGDDGNRVVPEIRTEDIPLFEKHITEQKSSSGRGGMHTKFGIAKKLMAQGITAHIANGKRDDSVIDIVAGKPLGTKFILTKKLSAVKRRLAYAEGLTAGFIYVNAGAKDVLLSKQSVSLLPVGVTKVEGNFKKGDAIEIRSDDGSRIGFGITQYDAKEADEVKGKKGARALVHYDYLLVSR